MHCASLLACAGPSTVQGVAHILRKRVPILRREMVRRDGMTRPRRYTSALTGSLVHPLGMEPTTAAAAVGSARVYPDTARH